SGLECVARSPDRSDPPRVLLVGLELAAQAVNMLGDRAGILPFAGRVPDLFEQLLSREDFPRRGRQEGEQIELLGRQLDHSIVQTNATRAGVDAQLSEVELRATALRRSAQNCAH